MASEFFNPDDGLTVTAIIKATGQNLVGYFDINDTDYYLDDSPEATRANFVCEAALAPNSVMAQTLTVKEIDYQITNYQPDGTGLVTLSLFSEG